MTGVALGSTVCVLLILGVHPGWWAGPLSCSPAPGAQPLGPAVSDLSQSRCLGGAVRGGWPSSESMGVSPRWARQDRGLRPRPLIRRGIRKGRDETQHVGAGRAQDVPMVGTARAQAAAEWPPRPQKCRWPRCTLAGGPRLAAGRVPDVLMFPHVPVAAAWGTLWAWTHKTRACRGPNPVTSA